MKYRIKLWRVNRQIKKGNVFAVIRLLNVTVGDKTEAQLVKAVTKAHKQLIDDITLKNKPL